MNVGVAGAGVVGSIVALEALRLGWDVEIFDAPDASRRCSRTAAGMLSPYAELECTDADLFAAGMRSLDRWPSLLAALPEPVFFRRDGSVLTAHPGDGPVLRRMLDVIEKKSGAHLAPVSSEWLRSSEPALSGRSEVYLLPDEGQIDSQAFVAVAGEHFLRLGLVRPAEVLAVSPHTIELEDGGRKQFHWVFDCRGLGARHQLPDLRPVRGEIIWVHAPEVGLRRPLRLMHPRYRIYVVPRPDDLYLVGATEIESDDRSPLSVRSALELLSALFSVHSGFAEARILRTDVNLRPAFPDNRPRIDHGEGVTRINGLFRHGFLLAPAVVQDAIGAVAERAAVASHSIRENAYAAD